MNGIAELRAIQADAQRLEIGASVTLAEVAQHPGVIAHYPVVAQAAASIAGPTHRNMGTVGGNLCLDTRCIFYNQSDWWRRANNHCLKTTGDDLPCGAQEPRRVLCHLQRGSGAGPHDARSRGGPHRPEGQAQLTVAAAVYRLRAP